MQPRAAEQGHTSRGFSGALHLKSATAGVDPSIEGRVFTVCAVFCCVDEWVLRNWEL